MKWHLGEPFEVEGKRQEARQREIHGSDVSNEIVEQPPVTAGDPVQNDRLGSAEVDSFTVLSEDGHHLREYLVLSNKPIRLELRISPGEKGVAAVVLDLADNPVNNELTPVSVDHDVAARDVWMDDRFALNPVSRLQQPTHARTRDAEPNYWNTLREVSRQIGACYHQGFLVHVVSFSQASVPGGRMQTQCQSERPQSTPKL